MPHRVCHISTVHPTFDNRIYHKECLSLARAGFETHLVVQGGDEERDGVIIHGLRKPKNRLDRMTHLVDDALKLALSVDAELYHLHDPELLRIAKRLKSKGKRVIFDSHEFYRYQIKEKDYLPRPIAETIAAIYTCFETSVCLKIDAVIIPCTRLGENPFANRALRTITVNNYPIIDSTDVQTVYKRASRESVCYVGALAYNRGITHLIRAAKEANVRVILAGPIDDSYKEQLEAMPEYENVEYRGYIDRSGVESVIAESYCGIAALLNVGQYWQGDNLPTKAYEYMAGGIPFIMSPTQYAKEFVAKYPCCLLVDPTDIEGYTEAIRMLQTDIDKAEGMARIGHAALVEEFNWNHEARKLVELYNTLLEG